MLKLNCSPSSTGYGAWGVQWIQMPKNVFDHFLGSFGSDAEWCHFSGKGRYAVIFVLSNKAHSCDPAYLLPILLEEHSENSCRSVSWRGSFCVSAAKDAWKWTRTNIYEPKSWCGATVVGWNDWGILMGPPLMAFWESLELKALRFSWKTTSSLCRPQWLSSSHRGILQWEPMFYQWTEWSNSPGKEILVTTSPEEMFKGCL